ncbi:MAG: D-alanyl-D-alanine carboxypeptidase/D-alanyl-D-alanine-endopeptidase [Nitrospirota bacterium]
MGNIVERIGEKSWRAGLVALLFLSLVACASVPRDTGFDELFDAPAFAAARWGAAVRSTETGRVVYRRDEQKAFTPASSMKLFTTAVALVKLGPEFRYTTELSAVGEAKDGILHGDLVVRGSGDPTLSAAVFEAWIEKLIAGGIREIRGRVIGDDTAFDDQLLGTGWSWDDETFGYAAQISGLTFNDNSITVHITPGPHAGDPATVKITPDTRYVTVINQAVTAPADRPNALRFVREPGANRIRISGFIAAASQPLSQSISVHNPTHFAATVLKEMLESKGIAVSGGALDIGELRTSPEYASSKTVAVYTSPPLSDLIRITNKLSRNLYAEQLFRTIGKVIGGEGSTARASAVMKDTLAAMGIPPEAVAIHDGSGLSRLNLVTPLHTVILLDAMAKHEHFSYFYDSLPVAGVDGTLERRMRSTGAESNVRAKTGYFSQVRALSGYLATREGELLAFSLLANNYLGSPADTRELQDRFCDLLSTLSRQR